MLCLKTAVAYLACIFVASKMYGQVFGQVGFLSETLIAARSLADEGTLTRVHPQVVEEVVPLAEKHLAATLIALEYLYLAHGSWVLVAVDTEGSSRGNRLFNFNCVKVKVFSTLYVDLSIFRHLILHVNV